MKTRTLLRLAIAVIAVGYLGYQYFKPKNAAAQTASVATAAPIEANAKEFTLGALHFKACELTQKHSGATTSAYCAPFQVLEDPDAHDKDARKIDLKLALIKSDAKAADTDIVVYLAGGPGQSAVETWPQINGAFSSLLKHHHVLLLDQRGTGQSHPLTCKGAPDELEGNNDVASVVRTQATACLAEVQLKADPRMYTTTIAIGDLEQARKALGSPLFDLVGVSYGTRVAQQYVMHFPQAVRSVILDSVAPNQLVLGQEFAIDLEQALQAQFARCTQTPACNKAFGDPYVSLKKLRDTLRAQPKSYDFRDPVTFAAKHKQLNDRSLGGLVRMFAYTPETAALLPLSIAEALKDDYAPLAGQTELLTGDLSDLADNGMQFSVICSEDADLLKMRPEDEGTMIGGSLIQAFKTGCEVWPHGTRPADFHNALKTEKPILILEGELDPVTPPRYGEQVLEGLSNARLLVIKGQGHNVIGRGCLPKLANEFVEQLDPKHLDATCSESLGATPAFIDFNGAAP